MRSLYRPVATLVLAVSVATCSDSPTGPLRQSPAPSNGIGREAVAFAPTFSKAASATAARLVDLSISYDRVRIVLVRPVSDTVKDTTIVFTPGSADVTLELNVDVRSPTEVFDGSIDYANATGVVFHGEGKVQAHPANQPAPTPQPIVVDYVGPGSRVAHIIVSPNPVTVLATETTSFTASAQDSSGAPIVVPVSWSVSDPSIASISQSGLFVPAGKRGTVTVTATSPTNVSGNASVTLALPPASISLVSGGGQMGKVGAALIAPAVVRVVAIDGLGVPGVSVNFGAPAGGSIGTPSVVTDAAGNASTSLQLGNAAGPQSFVASTGSFSVAIPEVATAGNAAAIAVASGSGQSDTVRHALKAPLVVRVSDALGNPVPGVAVNWAKAAGGGTLGAATSTTGADGLASVGYTLGSTAGTETVSASAAGVTATASFTMTAVPAAPSGVSVVSGADQTGTAGAALASPIVVKVVDAASNPVGGAAVSWSSRGGTVTAGVTTTGADGLAPNTFTLGTVAGAYTVTASVSATASVTLGATAVAGTPASLVWKVQPTATAAGSALAPALQVAIVDANGNVTSSTNAISLTLAGGTQGAQLTGTTTKAAVAGVATFDDLKLDLVGSGYTLVATGAGITPTATSSAFTVAAGSGQSATQLLLVPPATPTMTLTAGSAPATPVALKTVDVNGVAIANVPVTITLARSSDPTNILTKGTFPSGANGLVSDVTAILGSPATVAGTFVVTAKSSSIPGASVVLTVTVQPAVASKLAMVTQPANAATSGAALSRQPIVQVQDTFGNVTSAGALQVTATPSAGTASGNVVTAGTATGTATFSTLTLTGSGNVTVTFSAPGMTPVTSTTVAVANTIPTQLLLDPAAPTNFSYVAGVALASPPSIKVLDAGNAPVSGVPVRIVVTRGPNTAPVAVFDSTRTTDGTGHVTFFGTLPTLAATYTATATSTSISGTSAVVTVIVQPAAATKLVFTPTTTTGYSGTAGSAITNPPVVVTAEDPFGNTATSFASRVGINITPSTNTSGASLSGDTATAATGVATFPAIAIGKSGSGYTFTAVGSGVTSAVSAPITIASAAASQLVLTTGATTTAFLAVNDTLPTLSYPSVSLLDPLNNAAANAGTVTYAVTSGATACTISGGTISVNASGIAALDRTHLSISNSTAGSCTIHAVSSVIAGTTYDFNVIVGPLGSASWIGKTSSSFTDPSNWSGSIVPDIATAVFIPRYTRATLTLTGDQSAASIALEAGASIDVGSGHTLTVNGNVNTTASGSITNGTVRTTGVGSVQGSLPTLTVAGTTTLAGATTVTAVSIPSGSLDIAGKTLNVSGAFGTSGSGILKMLAATPANAVNVTGNATFDGGSETGLLTEGAFTLSGNFTQSHATGGVSSSFAPSGVNFSVYFSARSGGADTVSFADPEYSFFANVVAYHSTTFTTRTLINSAFTTNGSGTVVTFSSSDSLHNVVVENASTLKFSQADNPITGSLDLLGNATVTATSGTVGITVTGATNAASSTSLSGITTLTSKSARFPQINGAAPGSTILTAATALTQTSVLSGPLVLQNALTVGGYAVSIGGNLSVTGTNGKLIMTNSNGHVTVSGNATFDGASTTGALTDGLLEITGNITQQSDVSTSSFVAANAHTTRLTGTAQQTLSFADPVNSQFYNLDVTNTTSPGVTGRRVTAGGAVSAASSSNLGGLDSLVVTGNIFPNYRNATAGKAPHITVLSGSSVALTANRTVGGGMSIPGTLDIAGHTLTILDSLIVDGTLNMLSATPANVVTVGGLARFKGASTVNHIEYGTLQVAGDFIEDGIATSFAAPSTNFLVQLNGTGGQSVSFTHPDTSNSHFGNLEIDNTSTNGVTFGTDVYVTGSLEQKGRLAIGSGRTTTVAGTASFRNGATTVIDGTMALGLADFYNSSSTTGSGTLTTTTCYNGSLLSGASLLVGTSFSLLNCIQGGGLP